LERQEQKKQEEEIARQKAQNQQTQPNYDAQELFDDDLEVDENGDIPIFNQPPEVKEPEPNTDTSTTSE
jgi:hypothetical protein